MKYRCPVSTGDISNFSKEIQTEQKKTKQALKASGADEDWLMARRESWCEGNGRIVFLFFLSCLLAFFSSLQEISKPARALIMLGEHSITEPRPQPRC